MGCAPAHRDDRGIPWSSSSSRSRAARNYLANLAIVTVLAAADGSGRSAAPRTGRTPLRRRRGGDRGSRRLSSRVSRHAPTTLALAGPSGWRRRSSSSSHRRGRSIHGLVVPASRWPSSSAGPGYQHPRPEHPPSGRGRRRSQVVATEVAWIARTSRRGRRSPTGRSSATDGLPGRRRLRFRRHRARLSVSDRPRPMRCAGRSAPVGRLDAVDTAPRSVDQFMAYRATWLANAFKRTGATYWVYTTGIDTSSRRSNRR
jgi:hypothetical protein